MKNEISDNHEVLSAAYQRGSATSTYKVDSTAYGYGLSMGNTEKPIREYAVVLLRYWWVVCLCAVIGFSCAVFRNKNTPKVYKSMTTISIGTYVPPLEGPMADLLRQETTNIDYINSQMPLLQSNVLATNVLRNNPEIRDYFENRDTLEAGIRAEDADITPIPVGTLNSYLGSVSYNQIPRSTLVQISAQANNPEIVAKIVNAHAEGFVLLVRQQRLQSASVNVDFLRNRTKESEERIKTISEKIYALSGKTGINFSEAEDERQEKVQLIRTLADNLASARLKRTLEESIFRELSNSSGSANVTILNPDQNTQARLFEISQFQNEYNTVKKTNGRAPYLKFLEEKISLAKGTIKQFVQRQEKEQEIKYKAAMNQEKLLENQFEKLSSNENGQTKSILEYRVWEKELKAAKEINDQIARRLEDAMVNAENGQKNVQILDRGLVPVYPSTLNTVATLFSGILLGVMMGISIAFVLDFRDNSIKSVSDLKRSVDLPVLGVVPSFSSEFKKSLGNNNSQGESKNKEVEFEPVNDHEVKTEPIEKSAAGQESSDVKKRDLGELTIIEADAFDFRKGVASIDVGGGSRIKFGNTVDIDNSSAEPEGKSNRVTKVKSKGKSSDIVLLSSPLSRESEAFRGIRASIQCCGLTEIPHKIMVTSGQKGDGKSTVAVNLATSFAQASVKTLIIDADLRIPSMHKFFDLDRNTPGLVDYLSGEIDYTEAIIESPIPSLHVLLAGHHTRTPGELLSSRQMVELIELLAVEYDQIIIDTPPVCYVADALLLSKLVDAVALVVRSNKTPRPIAEFAFSRLKQVHAPILGTVLNAVNKLTSFREPEYYYIEEEYAEK